MTKSSLKTDILQMSQRQVCYLGNKNLKKNLNSNTVLVTDKMHIIVQSKNMKSKNAAATPNYICIKINA